MVRSGHMATKYLCDICRKEISREQKVAIIGYPAVKFEEICLECWKLAEVKLTKLAKQYSK